MVDALLGAVTLLLLCILILTRAIRAYVTKLQDNNAMLACRNVRISKELSRAYTQRCEAENQLRVEKLAHITTRADLQTLQRLMLAGQGRDKTYEGHLIA